MVNGKWKTRLKDFVASRCLFPWICSGYAAGERTSELVVQLEIRQPISDLIPDTFYRRLAAGWRRQPGLRARSAAVSEAGVSERRLLDRRRGGDRRHDADCHLGHPGRLQAQEHARPTTVQTTPAAA